MSKALFDKEKPFGLIIKYDKNKKIGIMNISNIPLQISVYNCDVINSDSYKVFRLMELIKQNPKKRKINNKKYSKEDINELIDKITKDFESRIKKIDGYKEKKYILCGEFVQKIVKNSNLELKNELKVPHPSYNAWDKTENEETINKLKECINVVEKSDKEKICK